MSGIFNLDNPFWRTMGKVGDIIALNVVWLVCCLPIVTIGPSTTALFYVMLKLCRDEEGGIFKQFFRSFRLNLRQGMIIGISVTVGGVLLLFDVVFYRDAEGQVATMFWWVSIVLLILYLMMMMYIFPMLAKFDNKIRNFFIFSVYLSIRHFGWTVVMLVITAAMILAMYLIYPPLILIFQGCISYWNSKILVKLFDRYIPEEKTTEAEGEFDEGYDIDEVLPPEEPQVHVVIDIDNPEPVVLGDTDYLESQNQEEDDNNGKKKRKSGKNKK